MSNRGNAGQSGDGTARWKKKLGGIEEVRAHWWKMP